MAGVPIHRGAFWTARQRDAHSLHEVSYRACFKPQLPAYFIERCTAPGALVYDPFGGRGTTALEAALRGRRVASNDVNPLSRILLEPRLAPPRLQDVEARLAELKLPAKARAGIDLSMFYHPRTEAELAGLRAYLRARGRGDAVDRWIRMVATNRLSGHSPGFFSVYSFPPNQAVSAQAQKRINARRGQKPEYRDVRALILKKSCALLAGVSEADRAALAAAKPRFFQGPAQRTPKLPDASVDLVVTSPPFLDVVQYADDNWLRGWFNGLDTAAIGRRITMARTLQDWNAAMAAVFRELHRVVKPGGQVAFEVGEVRKGTVKLEESVLPLGSKAGFTPREVMIHEQKFTKTAHIWGVANHRAGTNSHRIVLFRR